MSVLQKLFHKRRNSKQTGIFNRKPRSTPSVIELPSKEVKGHDEPSVFVALPPPDVRLVLFQECGDTSDRRLLFDSKSFEPQKPDTPDNSTMVMSNLQHGHVNNNAKRTQTSSKTPGQYNYVRGPQDSEIVSEMLFGSVGMASRASSLKIHIMKNPHRLMLSRVFCVESAKDSSSLERGLEPQRPAIPVLSRRKANTLPVPTPEPPYIPPPVPQSLATSLTSRLTRSDSSSSLISFGAQIFGASLGATGSLGSRPIPPQFSSTRAHSLPPATRQASRDSFTLTTEPNHGVMTRRMKVKIGFAVMFQPEPSKSSEFQRFFFEHFPLIESYLTLLKEKVESALNNSRRSGRMEFIEAMMEALQFFTLRVSCIYSTPRLPRPVWSTLTSVTSQGLPWQGNRQTISWFISDLTRTVDQYNTKQRNYFMSGLITSVLTHHLGWVNTTIAGSNNGSVTYNPLWAQLGDLYGAVGTPTKVAKTVIVGEIHEIVSTIISILSYFIRSSDISEVVSVPTDMTPQAFSENNAALSMSYVKSELENSDYVLVSCSGAPQSTNCDENKEPPSKTPPKTMKDKLHKFCRKNKNSQPIEVKNDATETSSGSTLCRSRSSPGTAAKPQHLKINRQISGGNFDAKPRVRTNSNDMFARPRGVQSRRTSQYEVANSHSRLCQSSSAAMISDLGTSLSLEGGKLSHCEATTAPSKDNSTEKLCSKEVAGNPTSRTVKLSDTTFLAPPKPKIRTHKRGSSEPFTIRNIDGSGSFPIVRQTHVDRIEPKVVNVGLVQRSQPVRAMQSPVSSPLLPRSKSSVGANVPILGFKTSENNQKMRLKHKSGSSLQDLHEKLGGSPQNFTTKTVNSPCEVNQRSSEGHKANIQRLPQGHEVKDQTLPQVREANMPRSSQGHEVKDQTLSQVCEANVQSQEVNVQRSSTEGVRRSSSSNSAKVKLTSRRHRLAESSNNSDGKIRHLPPLGRIPSISLKHDDFDEYFPEGEKSEFIFFSTENDKTQSCVMKNQSTVTNSTEAKIQPISTPIANTAETKPTVTYSVNVKAENHSSMTRRAPPPLPTVGPVHRSNSEVAKKVAKSPNSGPKSAPPLPTAPPIHRGSLYPNLNPPNVTPLPKYSIYPNLNEKSELKPTNLYSKLENPPEYDSIVSKGSLYPKLPEPVMRNPYPVTRAQLPIPEHLPQSVETPITPSTETFSAHEKLSLRTVEFTENAVTVKKSQDSDDKQGKLLFGQLLADYSPEYLWGFALHGTKPQAGLDSNIRHELRHSVSRPVLDEPVAEAVTIVADTDKWTVEVLSSHRLHSDKIALTALKSKLVTEILEKIKKLYQMNVPPEFCLKQLEQSLGELVLKSRMLAGYVNGNTRVTMPQLSAVLGIESSDLPLLMAIACCHSPEVAAKLLVSNY